MSEMASLTQTHPSSRKIFISRDYSAGTAVKFCSKFPPELENRIDRATFDRTMAELNDLYAQAEDLSCSTFCESCMACLTAYLTYLCCSTHYEKTLRKIRRYIHDQNEGIYKPRGLLLIDPYDRGLRVLEICISDSPR